MSFRSKAFLALVVALVAAGPLVGVSTVVQAAPLVVAAPTDAPSSPGGIPEALLYGLGAVGAIRIRDTATLAKKFVQRAGAASNEYTEGVKAAGQDWETGARNGADNYRIAVTQAANEGRFEKGIAAAGAAKFVAKASTLGPQRFQTGVSAAEGDWARGSQPYLDSLKSMELPPRRPRGQNADRANAVATRLHQMRVGK